MNHPALAGTLTSAALITRPCPPERRQVFRQFATGLFTLMAGVIFAGWLKIRPEGAAAVTCVVLYGSGITPSLFAHGVPALPDCLSTVYQQSSTAAWSLHL